MCNFGTTFACSLNFCYYNILLVLFLSFSHTIFFSSCIVVVDAIVVVAVIWRTPFHSTVRTMAMQSGIFISILFTYFLLIIYKHICRYLYIIFTLHIILEGFINLPFIWYVILISSFADRSGIPSISQRELDAFILTTRTYYSFGHVNRILSDILLVDFLPK